MLPFSSVR
jgi:hypothetical protein